MEKCDNCLCHLPVCKAECCKQFRIKINPRFQYKQGHIVKIKNDDDDFELYAKLHGFEADKDFVYVPLIDFERKGRYLMINARCKLLSDDNKCTEHFTKNRPKICDYPNKDGVCDGIYLTPNCVFKKKQR